MSERAAAVPREIEIKLGIAADAATQVLAHPAVAAVKRGSVRRRRVDSLYFDTPEARLAHAGVALRVRRDGTRWLQTLKGEATQQGGLSSRVEIESPLPARVRPPALDFAALEKAPVLRRTIRAVKGRLAPLFVTSFERTSVPIVFDDGTRAELAVDVGEVGARHGDANVRTPVSEIEIELVAGDRRRLFELALALARDLPVHVEARSKAQRGYALARAVPLQPLHAQAVTPHADDSAAGALSAVLSSALRQVEANACGMLDGDDPEWVHQLRVGVRRQRAVLWLAKRLLSEQRTEPLKEELRWIAASLGRTRDLDVLVVDTLPLLAAAEGNDRARRASLRRLDKRARDAAQRAREVVREDLRSPRFCRLVLSLGAMAADATLGEPPESKYARRLARPAGRVLTRKLERAHRRIATDIGVLPSLGANEAHRLRIAVKKQRYALDAVAGWLPDRARAYRKALAGLQELLGASNDLVIARRLAEELVPEDESLAQFITQHADRHAFVEADLARAARRFTVAGNDCFG